MALAARWRMDVEVYGNKCWSKQFWCKVNRILPPNEHIDGLQHRNEGFHFQTLMS